LLGEQTKLNKEKQSRLIPGGTTQREAQTSVKQRVALFFCPNLYNISTTGRETAPLSHITGISEVEKLVLFCLW